MAFKTSALPPLPLLRDESNDPLGHPSISFETQIAILGWGELWDAQYRQQAAGSDSDTPTVTAPPLPVMVGSLLTRPALDVVIRALDEHGVSRTRMSATCYKNIRDLSAAQPT